MARDPSGGSTPSVATPLSGDAEYRARLQRALGEDYRLGDLIGRGGFGAVYAARDLKLDRDVAVKALRHDVFPTTALLRRFQREARAVARLRHPHVLSIYTVGEGEGVAYMVMPRVEGESLREVISREGRLPAHEAVRIMAEVAAGLEAAHKVGIVHRDVKPANVMLDGEERRALLMDFGIAKAGREDEDEGMTGTGVAIGSPVYMSPEQAAGERDVDGRSDVYSLGAMGYEMLTGRLPFPARNLHELVYKQVTQDIPEVESLAPAVPEHAARAVMRCLAADREERWQTAGDFRRAVTAAGGGATAADEGVPGEEESWLSRRGPYVLVLLFTLLAIHTYEWWMRDVIVGPGAYRFWTGRGTLQAAWVVVLVMLVAAGIDLAFRVAVRLFRGSSWRRIARFVLGQPEWWQVWYPRGLRVRDSVWDRLPFSMKLLRTLVWLELLVLPAGWALTIFVVPTFQVLFAQQGLPDPLTITLVTGVVHGAVYVGVATFALLFWKLHVWERDHGVPASAALASLFTLRGSDWQGSPVRAILED